MRKSRWTLTFAAGLVIAGLGIGAAAYLASTKVEAQSNGLPESLDWMPATATLVGHIDFSSLMNSPLSAKWEESVGAGNGMSGLDEFREMTGLDPFNDVSGASFAVVAPSDLSMGAASAPERWGAAIHGSFDAQQLLARMQEHASVEAEEYASTTIYRVARTHDNANEDGLASSRSDPAFAFAATDTILLGEPEFLKQMLDVGAGREPSAGASVAEHWGEELFVEDTFWLAASPEQGFGEMLPEGADLPPIEAFAFSGRFDADVLFRARGRTADSEAATKLADVVRGFVALGSLQQSDNPDLGAVLGSIQIEQVENEIAVSLSVPYETLERLSRRATPEAGQGN